MKRKWQHNYKHNTTDNPKQELNFVSISHPTPRDAYVPDREVEHLCRRIHLNPTIDSSFLS